MRAKQEHRLPLRDRATKIHDDTGFPRGSTLVITRNTASCFADKRLCQAAPRADDWVSYLAGEP